MLPTVAQFLRSNLGIPDEQSAPPDEITAPVQPVDSSAWDAAQQPTAGAGTSWSPPAYDPRQYDEGQRETGPAPWTPTSPEGTPASASVTQPAPPQYDYQIADGRTAPPTPGGDWRPMEVRQRPEPMAQQEPPNPYGAPRSAAADLNPGAPADYGDGGVMRNEAQRRGIPNYQTVQSQAGEPDYVPPARRPLELADVPRIGSQVAGAAMDAARNEWESIKNPTAFSIASRIFGGGMVGPGTQEVGNIVMAAINQFGDSVGRRVAQALGVPDGEFARIREMTIAGYKTPEISLSNEDVAGLIGSVLLDPTNLVGMGEAKPVARAGMQGAREIAAASPEIARAGLEAGKKAGYALAEEAAYRAFDAMPVARVVPPGVADTLDFPVRIPEDPRAIRAIERIGGTVDPEKGVTFHVTRAQGPQAAGGVATRGGVFYEAVEPTGRSSFVRGSNDPTGVGGSQVIPSTPTRFRSPLILSEAPGAVSGFDDAMRKIGVERHPDVVSARQAADSVLAQGEELYQRRRALMERWYDEHPNWTEDQAEAFRSTGEYRQLSDEVNAAGRAYMKAKKAADAVEAAHPALTAENLERALREARNAGPEASPERAAALKAVVEKYGGDPDLIDPLLAIRGADAGESQWAIRENILAAHARRNGYDGVVTLQNQGADPAAINSHPLVVAADAKIEAAKKAVAEAEAARAAVPQQGGDLTRAYAKADNAIDDAYGMLTDAKIEYAAARDAATVELGGAKISELVDVREGRNPTPGAPMEGSLTEIDQQLKDARAKFREMFARMQGENPPSYAEVSAAQDEVKRLEDVYDRILSTGTFSGPPGYTLRDDVPRRDPSVPKSTVPNLPQIQARESIPQIEARLQSLYLQASEAQAKFGPNSPEAMALWNQSDDLYAELEKAKSLAEGGKFSTPASGILPFDPASAALGAGAGATGQDENGDQEFDPYRAAGGAAVAGVLNFRRFPGVQKALQASQQRAARMAASGQKPLNPLQWTRKLAGELGYSSMIGPATFTVNLAGNVLEPLWAIPKEVARAGLPQRMGGRGNIKEAGAMAAGALDGMTDVWSAIKDAMLARGKYAATPGHEPLSAQTVNPIGRAVTSALEAGGRFWSGVPDAIFGTIAQGAGEARAAAQAATDAGLTGSAWSQRVQDILADAKAVKGGQLPTLAETQGVIDAGAKYAKDQTFQSELGTIGRNVKDFATVAVMPDGKGGRSPLPVVGNLVTPFFNTPWNMNNRLAERTPVVGAFMNTQRGFDKAYDQVVGTAVVVGMGSYAYNCGITGNGPSDPQKRKELEAEGWRPYSTLIGGTYIPNRAFGVFGPLLNAAGDTHDALAYAKDKKDVGAIASDYGGRIGKQLQQQPYLQGLADLVGALEAGQGGGLGSASERYLSSNITRMVPYAATARTIGSMQDPLDRTTDRGKETPFLTRIGQQVRSGVGNRQGFESMGQQPLPAAQDVLGRPKENPQAGAKAFFSRTGTQTSNPVTRTFFDAGVDISDPPSAVNKVTLTEAQKRRWNAVRGQALLRARAEIQGARSLPLAERQAELKRILREASTEAGDAVEASFTQRQRDEALKPAS